MVAGMLNSTLKLNCVLVVRGMLRVVLTTEDFAVDKALMVLSELETKIYENFPKIRMDDENERLLGATVYVSNVCSKYTTGESQAQRRLQDIEMEIADNVKNNVENLQISRPSEVI